MYPRWVELNPLERSLINNGCGPVWFPGKLKRLMNKYLFAWMFYASCGHHDFGYIIGGTEKRRLYCDYKLTVAMAKDVRLCYKHKSYLNAIIGTMTGIFFAIMVFLFGWLVFNYGQPKSKFGVVDFVTMPKNQRPGLKERLKKWRW